MLYQFTKETILLKNYFFTNQIVMKTGLKLTFTLLTLSLGFSALSQTSVGIRGGLNLATLSDSKTLEDEIGLDRELLIGFSVAAIAEIGVTEDFFVQPEIAYTRKGIALSGTTAGIRGDVALTLDYFDLFLLGKYKIGEGPISGYLAAGPQLGYANSGKTKLEFGSIKEEDDVDLDEDFNRFEVGISAGGGISITIDGGPVLFFDARYVLGLTKLNDDDSDDKIKNRGIGINLGALFPIGN